MNRRSFLKSAAVSSLGITAGILTPAKILASPASAQKKLKPKRLVPGDKIGIIAPASFITEKDLAETVDNLKALGFEPVPSPNPLKKLGYLAGNDAERVKDIHTMFADKEIKGIMCARGGYGTPRILNMLDYKLIKRNPKVLIGYSDITALLIAITEKTGLITFHGPVGTSTYNEFSVNYFKKTLMEPEAGLELITEKEKIVDNENKTPLPSIDDIFVIKEGKATGELIGGNLSLVVSMMGTPAEFSLKNKLVFLEEIGEEPYRVDRMLTQLLSHRDIKKVKGFVLGKFSNCEVKKNNPEYPDSFNLKEVLTDRFSSVSVPVIYGLSFGHIRNKFVLPVGLKAEMSTESKTLRFLETAVR